MLAEFQRLVILELLLLDADMLASFLNRLAADGAFAACRLREIVDAAEQLLIFAVDGRKPCFELFCGLLRYLGVELFKRSG